MLAERNFHYLNRTGTVVEAIVINLLSSSLGTIPLPHYDESNSISTVQRECSGKRSRVKVTRHSDRNQMNHYQALCVYVYTS